MADLQQCPACRKNEAFHLERKVRTRSSGTTAVLAADMCSPCTRTSPGGCQRVGIGRRRRESSGHRLASPELNVRRAVTPVAGSGGVRIKNLDTSILQKRESRRHRQRSLGGAALNRPGIPRSGSGTWGLGMVAASAVRSSHYDGDSQDCGVCRQIEAWWRKREDDKLQAWWAERKTTAPPVTLFLPPQAAHVTDGLDRIRPQCPDSTLSRIPLRTNPSPS